MDFVANRNFLNGPKLNVTLLAADKQPFWASYPKEWKASPLYVHKGMRFSTGPSTTVDELKANQDEATKTLWLAHPNTPLAARQAVPLSETKLVAKIDGEVKTELAAFVEASKPQPSMEEMIASAVTAALAAAGIIKPAGGK